MTMFQPDYTDCSNCGTVDHNDYDCPCSCHGDEAPSRTRQAKLAESTWDRIDAVAIRQAIDASTDGRSGRYVYARASTDNREFRIVGFRVHRGLAYGRELSSGKWVVIGSWQER